MVPIRNRPTFRAEPPVVAAVLSVRAEPPVVVVPSVGSSHHNHRCLRAAPGPVVGAVAVATPPAGQSVGADPWWL